MEVWLRNPEIRPTDAVRCNGSLLEIFKPDVNMQIQAGEMIDLDLYYLSLFI